ncbi:hypothetical protein A3K73_03270 [Candidatus Pacearchaeota archaeon RBG_13_36_9]|nr:MAG: hypothetical protein A3K73_03270 [Candidatus Pacearchaeota archaeon RBG_13_36_9]
MIKRNKKGTRALTLDRDKMLLKSKRSQNEIVGFVMIVVIVVIIGLFLLAFYLRRDTVRTESKNVENFLVASLPYTTSCKVDIEPLNIKELTKRCYEKRMCGENDSCVILNETFSELLEQAWKLNSNRPINYYNLKVYYREGGTENGEEKIKNEEILVLKQGNCTGAKTGAEKFFRHGMGDIFLELELCYN